MRPVKNHVFILPVFLLGGLLMLIYWPALTGQFVNHDDPLYISGNPVILQGLSWHSFLWSFTSISVGHWHPVTWLSHLAAIEMFGTNPFGHHLINLLLHILNSCLLALLLNKLTGQILRSWLVAMLFAVHPLNVETVAWIAERKGVLETFFWLLALLSYVRYAHLPVLSRYLPVLLFFLLSLMSKAVAVTLPCVLLLLDFWPLGRFGKARHGDVGPRRSMFCRLTVEKLPLFVLGIVSGVTAMYVMGQAGAISGYSPLLRLQNAVQGYSGYILKLFNPAELSIIYPFVTRPSGWGTFASLASLLLVSALVILTGKKLPYLFTGWFWYVVTLAPVIGFISLGQQTMPDRYVYIPIMGLLVMIVWGGGDMLDKFGIPLPLRVAAATAVIALLGFISNRQAAYWHDSVALFSHAIAVNPYTSLAHTNLGSALFEKGDNEGAFREFRAALRINPNYDDAWNNLGATYSRVGRADDAIEAYLLALASNPRHALAHMNLGIAYARRADWTNAEKEYRILLKLNPEYAGKLKAFLP